MKRREFIGISVAAGAETLLEGCRSLREESSFYGSTIRDRLWMWGHHADSAKRPETSARSKAKAKGEGDFKWPGRVVDQAEGCRIMGVPNNCVIRWCNLPKYPWGNYFDQFRGLKRISFGIHDGGTESTKEKMRIAFEELQPAMPNLTGCFLDDYFLPWGRKNYVPDVAELGRISDAVHAHGLRLSVVAYSDQVGGRRSSRTSILWTR